MLSLYNIWTVARFEMKTLLRSWFFRIFSGLALIILVILNIALHSDTGAPWLYKGIPGSMPYMNILLLNVIQAVIAVFLASDFLKRDKKLDTTEVVYMRSMTNGDYVLGKSLGIMIIFLMLNLVVLFLAGIINVVFTDVPVQLAAYVSYLLLISIPTLIFIFGLSFLFMVLIRNQPVTFLVLLGYIALTLFFFKGKFHALFDYMAFYVPMLYSDFIGFGNLPEILIQRGIYVFLGLGFIFATIVLLQRLPQSQWMQRFSRIIAVVFVSISIFLGVLYLSVISRENKQRARMISLNDEYAQKSRVFTTQCDLELTHQGKRIQGTASLRFENATSDAIDTYVFRLNPGLDVTAVEGSPGVTFKRDHQILLIQPAKSLAPQSADSLVITYQGGIQEAACYLDIDEEKRQKAYREWLYTIDKRHAIISSDYVLLTPEAEWYPMAGAGHSPNRPAYHPWDFIQFSLNVKTDETLTAYSQGSSIQNAPGDFSFKSEYPLPQLSLAIGAYKKRSITVDSVEYAIMTLKNHDYFTPFFTELGDTLPSLIRDMKQDYENKLELSYAYDRVSLIEVPIQFFSYKRGWTTGMETVQPEMVFLPEKGVLIRRADFSQMARWEKRRMERFNQVVTPAESQSRNFTRFIDETLLSEGEGGNRFRRGGGSSDEYVTEVSYSLFPNCYTFVNNVQSQQWPIMNVALESFLNQRTENAMFQAMRGFFMGLTDEEKTNLALEGRSMESVLADPDQKDIILNVIKSKGNYLFTLLQSRIGDDAFKAFLTEILSQSKFRTLNMDEIFSHLNERYGFDFKPHVEEWYDGKSLPSVRLSDVKAYSVLDGNRTRYQVRFKLSNTGSVSGLISVTFRAGGGQGRGMGPGRGPGGDSDEVKRVITLAPNEAREIGVVLDAQPRMMTVNTLISRNLPSIMTSQFEDIELKKNATPFDGQIVLDELPSFTQPGEIIVDNEDPGFQFVNPGSTSPLKRLLRISSDDEERYVGMQFWRPPTRWVATTGSNFYGDVVQSAHYTRAGDGERKVVWNTVIPENGYYDVYAYVGQMRRMGRRGRGGDRNESVNDAYHYIVSHDDGTEETVLEIENAEDGWNFLGGFYFSADSARVELTNESPGRVVMADAVKWVRK